MTITHLHRPPATLPVPYGTAVALATVAHYSTLDNPDNDGLRHVWRLLIGPVPNADDVWEHLHDELLQLWDLVNDDWSEDQLDELTDDEWRRYDFPTQQQEADYRLGATIERLSSDVESYIARKRHQFVELAKVSAGDLALLAVAR